MAQDTLFEGAKEDSIGFKLIWKDGTKERWRFNYNREADVIELASKSTNIDVYKLSLFNDNFHYLQAERIGPRTYFEMSDFQVRQHRQIGSQGEYTAHFLSIYQDKEIPTIKTLKQSWKRILAISIISN